MSFLYYLIIVPIETIVDWVFIFISKMMVNLGVMGMIVGVSLVINFLALPLYNKADALQEKERLVYRRLEPRIKRIKKAFKGDERFMMLSEYYRQNDYNPIFVLRSSLSILIEIPFFIAAYHYLSHSPLLMGASFWIFRDLGSPDRMFILSIGSLAITINILPILMTVINLVSGAIYTKGGSSKEKIQIFAMALFFLYILYDSPSGLVIYWIMNNLFSLVKNIVLKTKHPRRILHGIFILISFLILFYYLAGGTLINDCIIEIEIIIAVIFVPLIIEFIIKKTGFKFKMEDKSVKEDFLLLAICGLGMSILCGFLLPVNAISTSPLEFSFIGDTASPLSYVWRSCIVFSGFFLFWPLCIFKMFGNRVKRGETILFVALFICALLNAFVFVADYGQMGNQFLVDNKDALRPDRNIAYASMLSFAVVLVLSCIILAKRKAAFLSLLMFSVCAAELLAGTVKIPGIIREFKEYQKSDYVKNLDKEDDVIEPVFHFSKSGKNVFVLFLDRALEQFFPYLLEDLPYLKEQMKGFVYYDNVVSFADNTRYASPAMLGGYEYSPDGMRERSELNIRTKHNEAITLLPRLFGERGFNVTVADPPYPNYSDLGDFSIFDDIPNTKAIGITGTLSDKYKREIESDTATEDVSIYNEIRNFAVIEVLLPSLRYYFYNNCRQVVHHAFYTHFPTMYYLNELTAADGEGNQYFFMSNETTHAPVFLDQNYNPVLELPDVKLAYPSKDKDVLRHYQVNIATFDMIGKWLGMLHEQGVYDNSRIIIVADHGFGLNMSEYINHGFANPRIPSRFSPLLLIKDFNAEGAIVTDHEFMTNADTLFLAKEGLGLSDINPYTGKKLVQNKENGINSYINMYLYCNGDMQEFPLLESDAVHVGEDIYVKSNWIPLTEWKAKNGGTK